MCIKLFIHPHLESFTAQCLQVGGGILGEISAQVVHHIIETFFATVCTSPNYQIVHHIFYQVLICIHQSILFTMVVDSDGMWLAGIVGVYLFLRLLRQLDDVNLLFVDNQLAFTGLRGNQHRLDGIGKILDLSFRRSNTWMPSNLFSLNSSFSWDNIINDIVPYWHEINGLMVKEMINSGSFNPIYINVTPSQNLAHGKIRLSSNISYVHEWHSGLFHINNGYWGLYPTLYCRLGKFWAVNLNYAYSSGEGYMRGSSNLTRFSDNLKLGLQYTNGNLFVKLQVNSLILKNGNTKSWLISDYIDSYSYQSRPWDRRYVSLSASYTLDYGKKINHGGNLKFNGTTKTSVL